MAATRILVVEEKQNLDESLTTTLEKLDFEVTKTVSKIDETFLSLEDRDIDIIIVDVEVNKENNFYKKLNYSLSKIHLPVVLLTNSLKNKNLKHDLTSPLISFLTKPYNLRELKITIELALFKSQTEKCKSDINSLLKTARKIDQIINTTHESKKLIKSICRSFVNSSEFKAAFIVLLGQSADLIYAAQSGLKNIKIVTDSLKKNEPPPWVKKILLNDDIFEINYSNNLNFPFLKTNQQSFNIRLESSGKTFGLLSVIFDKRRISKEEKFLFKSIAADIAFSLNNIEIKSKNKNIEEILTRSEAKYRMVIENATDIIFTTNEFGYFTFVNNAGLLNTGFTEEELLRLNYLDLILPEYKKTVQNFYREQVESKKTSAYIEYPFSSKRGEIKWYGQNSTLIIENNNFKGFHCISRDISERKKIEYALQESELKYRHLVESSPNAIIVHNKGKIVFVNNACLKLAGVKNHSDLLGKQIVDFMRPNSKDISEIKIKSDVINSSNGFSNEYKFLREDGKPIDVEMSLSPVIYNNENCIQVVINDISERKIIEEELRKRQSEVTTLIDNLPGFAFLKDVNGRYIIANRKFCNVMGVSKDKLIGKTDHDLLSREQADFYHKHDLKVINSGRMQYVLEEKTLIDNKYLTIGTRKVPLKDEDGNVFGLIGLGFDITEQKEAEEAIKKYTKELEELNSNKDKFFSIISHDLRSPFQGLLGLSSALVDEYENLNEEEKHLFLDSINVTAKNLYSLIENLLQWSRAQKSNIEMNLTKIELHDEIDYSISLLQNNAANKNIQILNIINKGIYVNSDVNILNSTMQNLISNAIKFTRPFGMITISSVKRNEVIELIVRDTGVGISEEDLDNLFRIEKRHTTPGTEKEMGTGLGLIICKELLEIQGGTISVKSKLGRGTEFTITLQQYLESK